MEVSVRVIANNPPDDLAIQSEDGQVSAALTWNQSATRFETKLPQPSSEASTQLVAPYRLVANWGGESEQEFLGLRTPYPEHLRVTLYHQPIQFTVADLGKIEALGSDFEGTLCRYARARAFHKHWRYELEQPGHAAALRSAKLWFDAAYSLATRANSIFRMDEEAAKIMVDYEEQAKNDEPFRTRFRRYVSPGYLAGMNAQLLAHDFTAVGKIPELISKGRLDEAMSVNDKAIAVLAEQTPENRRSVLQKQGVSVAMLQENSKYIATLQRGIQ
jgi:hypothetical protein